MIIILIILLLSYLLIFIWMTKENNYYLNNIKFDSISDLPSISVIISARNEEKNINNLCKCLLNQRYPYQKLEIIIVNDRSNDKTESLLNNWQKKISYLKVLNIKKTPIGWDSKKWALNQAIINSKNDILIQTDADCIFEKNWLISIVQPFADSKIGFVSGPAPLIHSNKFIHSLIEIESLSMDAFFANVIRKNIPMSCTGRNMGFRKEAFIDVDGYQGISNQISGDDDLLLQKISSSSKWLISFVFNQNAIVESPGPESIETFIIQRLRWASKGLKYYDLPTTIQIKLFLPYIFLCNFFVVCSLITFLDEEKFIWLTPFLLKTIADGLVSYIFFNEINRTWSIKAFLIMSFIHPFYVTIFSIIAPFTKINWKNN